MANKSLTVEQLIHRGESEGWTAYGIAKLVNAMLKAEGLPEIRSQMVYNYDRQGMVVKGTRNVTATRTFTTEEAKRFAERYVERAKARRDAATEITEAVKEEQCEGQEALELEI